MGNNIQRGVNIVPVNVNDGNDVTQYGQGQITNDETEHGQGHTPESENENNDNAYPADYVPEGGSEDEELL